MSTALICMSQNFDKHFLWRVMTLRARLMETKIPRQRQGNICWEDREMSRTPPENETNVIQCCRKLTFITISHNNRC